RPTPRLLPWLSTSRTVASALHAADTAVVAPALDVATSCPDFRGHPAAPWARNPRSRVGWAGAGWPRPDVRGRQRTRVRPPRRRVLSIVGDSICVAKENHRS